MPNITVNVPALEKLLDYTASGIGSIAGSMLAPWKARQEAKALAEQSQGQANAIQIIEGARNRARNELISQPYSARWEIDVGSSISQRIQYQEEKRQRNIESVVRQAAEELEDKSVPDEEPTTTGLPVSSMKYRTFHRKTCNFFGPRSLPAKSSITREALRYTRFLY